MYCSTDGAKRKRAAEEQALLVGASIGNNLKEGAHQRHISNLDKSK